LIDKTFILTIPFLIGLVVITALMMAYQQSKERPTTPLDKYA